ncbi:MAG TPA: hypothetical protein VK699_21175 [Terriglobales bacterium]|jgi:hypothetical protein|nr:hypothetical protein [Terriglobales bacterium]
MKVLLRLSAALLALVLLAGVVYLGILSGRDNKFVVWFGIASAIVAPVGLALLGYALTRSNSELIQRLAQVPEIEHLVAEAKTQEEKVRVLEAEEARLVEIIQLESRRQAARDRTESLERDGVRIIQELDSLAEEMRFIDNSIGKSIASEEIERLRQRVRARERGDVILRFGTRTYAIDHDIITALPFGTGNIILVYLRLLERFQQRRKGSSGMSKGAPPEPPGSPPVTKRSA